MEIPVGLKPGLWGVAVGAIGMAIIGFTQLGWMSAASAEKMAQETASSAVVTAMVPFCVAKAHADPNPAVLAKFQAEQSSYSRGDLVAKAGWASIDGKPGDSGALPRACADKLYVARAG